MSEIKRFIMEEEAMGTVEVVLISAVLVGLGIMFKSTVYNFVKGHLDQFTGVNVNINDLNQ